MTTPLRVLVVDDHPLIRDGVRHLLTGEPDMICVGEAPDGVRALALIRDVHPDIAVIDVDMPGTSGLDVARIVMEENLPTDIVILTMYREEDMFNAAMDLGIRGYVLKDSAVTEIVSALRTVAKGKYYISPRVSEYLLPHATRVEQLLRNTPALDALTATERRVLARIADQRTTKEIAAEMSISPKTVDNHRTNIAAKLNLRGSHSLLKFAIEHRTLLARY